MLIYSSRADPHWTLPAEQNAELWTRIAALPNAATEESPQGQLAYARFEITHINADGRPRRIRVDRGHLTIEIVRVQQDLSGPERRLEAWLLQSGGDGLDARVRWHVDQELKPK